MQDLEHDELARFRALNEQLDAKKEELLRRADELMSRGRSSSSPRVSASFSPSCPSSARSSFEGSLGNFTKTEEGAPPTRRSIESLNAGYNNLMDDDELIVMGNNKMGPEATNRFLIAKSRLLKEELAASNVKLRERDANIVELKAQLSDLAEREAQLTKMRNFTQAQLDKLKKTAADNSEHALATEQQLQSVQKELDNATKQLKTTEQDHSAREMRLQRSLEEVERLKSALRNAQTEGKDDIVNNRKKAEKCAVECKRLERLNAELLNIIRKQFRFIDVLKRAKMHSEVAHLLHFTEEEFARILELGDKL